MIVFLAILKIFSGGGAVETVAVLKQDIVRTTRIAGKVISRESVELGFETSGTISFVGADAGQSVLRGQTLLALDASTIAADVRRAEAELLSAQAELNKLQGGQGYEASILIAKRNIVQTMREAFTAAEDAIYNKTDQLFINPGSSYPKLRGYFRGYNSLRENVEEGRVETGYLIHEWEKIADNLKSDDYTSEELRLSKEYLAQVIVFIGEVTRATNLFEATDSLPQVTIDAYKADMLSARNSLNTASQKFIDAEKSYSNTFSEVPVQAARVEAARATLSNLRSQLGKISLISPISGLVARQEGKRGQAVSAGMELVTVISPDYIIETFVPEVSIAGIALGNRATVTLDAYGSSEVFEAVVEHIDPAETIRDGVSTYKVKLSFVTPDQKIRSGMTANVEIETFRKPQVETIPDRTVVRENGEAYVYVLVGEKETLKRKVLLGERDTRGNVELISGISQGEKIMLDPDEK